MRQYYHKCNKYCSLTVLQTLLISKLSVFLIKIFIFPFKLFQRNWFWTRISYYGLIKMCHVFICTVDIFENFILEFFIIFLIHKEIQIIICNVLFSFASSFFPIWHNSIFLYINKNMHIYKSKIISNIYKSKIIKSFRWKLKAFFNLVKTPRNLKKKSAGNFFKMLTELFTWEIIKKQKRKIEKENIFILF